MYDEKSTLKSNKKRAVVLFVVGAVFGILTLYILNLFFDALMRNRTNAFSNMNINYINEQLPLLAKAIESGNVHEYIDSGSFFKGMRQKVNFGLISEQGVVVIYDEGLMSSTFFIPYKENDEIKWLCIAGNDRAAGWSHKCRVYSDGTELFNSKSFAVFVRNSNGSIDSSLFGERN